MTSSKHIFEKNILGDDLMYKFLYNPKEALKDALKINFSYALLYLVISVVLWFFAVKIQDATWLTSLYVLIGALILVLVGSLVLNLLLLVLGKSDYSKALVTLTVPWFVLSVVAFVLSLITMIPIAGVYIVALILLFALPYVLIVEIKLFMDLFKLDIITTVVVLFILGSGTAAGFATILGSFAVQLVGKIGFGLLPTIL